MTIQRIGTTERMQAIPGIKVMPIISFAVVHNGVVDLCGITAEPEGDVKVQTKKVLELLQMAGTDKSKLLFAHVLAPI
jgi:hypothetical protein